MNAQDQIIVQSGHQHVQTHQEAILVLVILDILEMELFVMVILIFNSFIHFFIFSQNKTHFRTLFFLKKNHK